MPETNAISDWDLRESEIPDTKLACGKAETLFSLANGHLGLRGDFEEPEPAWQRGTYINGFFETEPIVYGELAYGFAKNHQTMLNLPDGRVIRLQLNGEEFSMTRGRANSYSRHLDLRRGILERRLSWTLPEGQQLDLVVRRLVSFTRPDTAAVSYAFKLRGRGGKLRLISELDTGSENIKAAHDPRVGSKLSEGCLAVRSSDVSARGFATATVETRNTRLAVTCGALTVLEGDDQGLSGVSTQAARAGKRLQVIFEGDAAAECEIKLTKYLVYLGPFPADGHAGREAEIREQLSDLAQIGFDALAEEQLSYMGRFWQAADIVIEGNAALQQAARFNVFHILQSAGKDGRSNMAAKGLSGEGYEGHYFWDTEIYADPLFTYTSPEVARQLLMYRHSILDKARERAAELDHRGALYPWRTIDGTEASAYYEAGTAQYHINGDIIFAARRYALVTGDRDFIRGPLAEMAVETARLWLDAGDFVERDDGLTVAEMIAGKSGAGRQAADRSARSVFVINTVTGPDEYTAMVNNNIYTNLMARANLVWAADLLAWLEQQAPEAHAELAQRLNLAAGEAPEWKRAADLMFVPYDAGRGLYPQDDAFFTKAIWDITQTPKEKRPLLLHYHPLVIYRHQILKQPDLVLAQFLQGDLFSAEEKRANFAYYEPLTTGDSSLSHCIQSIMAVETGDVEKGWSYFQKTVRMDLDDLHGNARDGIHAAAMAGSWLSLVYGFGGFREHIETSQDATSLAAGALPQRISYSFSPVVPQGIRRLSFRLRLGASLVEVDTRHGERAGSFATTYRLVEGEALRFNHGSLDVSLAGGRREQTLEALA
jgi:trehalose/maltose hydrolase-like predicted phosphorylase